VHPRLLTSLPALTKFRREIEDAIVASLNMDSVKPNLPEPKTLILDPSNPVERIDNVDPSNMASKEETLEPSLDPERNEKELPKEPYPIILRQPDDVILP
jgi:hypothetical protein